MGKRRVPHPTSEKILQVATELMWRQGYQRTSPAQVMEGAGVGQGSFYHHFPDKRSLGLAVVQRLVATITENLEEVFDPALPPFERIRKWIHCFLDEYRPPCDRGCPLGKLGYEMAGEDPAFREALADGFARIREKLTGSIREAAASNQLSPLIEPEGLAELLLAAAEGTVLLVHCDGDAGGLDRSLIQLDRLLDLYSAEVRG